MRRKEYGKLREFSLPFISFKCRSATQGPRFIFIFFFFENLRQSNLVNCRVHPWGEKKIKKKFATYNEVPVKSKVFLRDSSHIGHQNLKKRVS